MIEGIEIPTLVIACDAELYAPPALMRRIADRVKGAEFIAMPDVGHSVWWEVPGQFNRTVLMFIAKQWKIGHGFSSPFFPPPPTRAPPFPNGAAVSAIS